MATFFGEVVPLNSRAVDEDEEEDLPLPGIKIQVHGEVLDPKEIRCVLFTCSATCSTFTKTQVLGLTSAGEIAGRKVLTVETETGDNASSDEFVTGLKYKTSSRILANVYLHSQFHQLLVCLCEESVWDDEYPPLVVEQLFDTFKLSTKASVAVLTSENSTYYKSPTSQIVFPLLRCLATGSAPGNAIDFPKLEQPNIVSGFSASILTECEIRGIPGIAYICFEATLDSSSSEELSSVLKMWPFSEFGFQSICGGVGTSVNKDTGNLYT